MKKTISVIVAIAMMLMVSIPAFAGNFDDNADLTAQQKVFAEVIFDGLNAGNNTADTLANYVAAILITRLTLLLPQPSPMMSAMHLTQQMKSSPFLSPMKLLSIL